jgi:hypothetical protein
MMQYATPPRYGTTPMFITGNCRICGASFESTDDVRRLCDEHLVECINGAGLIEDDDELFNTPRRAPVALARIHCRVCDVPAEQPITTPGLLCPLCREDLGKTEVYIQGVVRAAEIRFLNARDLHQTNVAQADEQTQQRYQKVLDALGAAHEGTLSPTSVRRRYNEARGRTDSLGALLVEREKAEEMAEEYARVQAWAERGLGEVEAAR